MDLCKVVSPYRFFLDSSPQCFITNDLARTSLLGQLTVPNPVETCAPYQLTICLAELSNVTLRIPSFDPGSTLTQQARVPPASIIALRLVVHLFASLLQLVIVIPFRLFLWIVSAILWHLHQISIDLLVHRKVEAFLLVTCATLIVLFIRRRMTYWRDRNIAYECFTAHLHHFGPFSQLITDADRVRRLGKIFG